MTPFGKDPFYYKKGIISGSSPSTKTLHKGESSIKSLLKTESVSPSKSLNNVYYSNILSTKKLINSNEGREDDKIVIESKKEEERPYFIKNNKIMKSIEDL